MRDTNEIVKEIYQEQGKIMQSVKNLVRVYKESGEKTLQLLKELEGQKND